MRTRILFSLLFGAIATAASMLVSFEYCIGGPGYGVPMAVIHPSHQEAWLVPLNGPPAVEGLAFDPLGLGFDVVVLSLLAFGIATAIARSKRKAVAALLAMFLLPVPASATDDRARTVETALSIAGDLSAIARTHPSQNPDTATRVKIDRILQRAQSVEELTQAALVVGVLTGGDAANASYDAVFDLAQWRLIDRLGAFPGEDASVALEFILKPVLGQDGHASELFRESIAKQRALRR